MQCAQHPEVKAAAYCSNCGLALCPACSETIDSRVLCSKCSQLLGFRRAAEPTSAAEEISSKPGAPTLEKNFVVPPIPVTEKAYPYCPPGVCLALGLIPGVGAICNGEYVKAFLHVLIFGSLVSLANSPEVGAFGPMFVILAIVFYLYMPLEAYHTSKKRTLALRGIIFISPFERIQFSDLWVGSLAVLFGSVFLIIQFVPGTIHFLLRGWPLALIGIGAYNLTRYFRSQQHS
jgi:hypothetical protein